MTTSTNMAVIVAARMGSSRLPGKAMLPLLERPMLELLLTRLKDNKYGLPIILATTSLPEDEILCEIAEKQDCLWFKGNPHDLVHRYIECAKHFQIDRIIRVTADCPFVDGSTLDYFLDATFSSFSTGFSLATTKGKFPVGIDFELFERNSLEKLHQSDCLTPEHREHLTLYFYHHQNEYPIKVISPPESWKSNPSSFTIDTLEDYNKAIVLTKNFKTPHFSVYNLINNGISCDLNIPNPA
ncbi:hypothetical protein CC99x_002075 [Candidatus Berkiella cookevillensis]|uniref:3-deoxy-manno-octulosonate cytidylyltransferase n=1 Tax=Candidatus Berkiella cookevillensis TaxID=437022 RepID=A0A0Q9YJ24_9GAMM|nr:hypothetical protein [Candidatus Berkiella cookevillensis]MCS5707686.1 hypothetical protein [Candidatus Berkiella cookevillensis]